MVPRSTPGELFQSRPIRARASRRGMYDRQSTPSERARLQRAELLLAVRQVVAGDEVLSVSSIAAARGFGRNTFYEHFSTVEAAVDACVQDCGGLLDAAIAEGLDVNSVATPSEHARRLGLALVTFTAHHADVWTVLLRHGQATLEAALFRAAEQMHRIYAGAGAGRAAWPRLALAAASGAVLGLLNEARGRDYADAEVVDELVATLGRLLR